MTDRQHKPAIVRCAGVSTAKRDFARRLRREATESERVAWETLRGRRCWGLKFRRQQVVRGYVVDFYCDELRLAIEIDGPIHARFDRAMEDVFRELQIVEEAGIRVLRVAAHLVTKSHLRALLLPLSRNGRGGRGVRL